MSHPPPTILAYENESIHKTITPKIQTDENRIKIGARCPCLQAVNQSDIVRLRPADPTDPTQSNPVKPSPTKTSHTPRHVRLNPSISDYRRESIPPIQYGFLKVPKGF